MAKPVNLNRFRKDKARAEKKVRASQNSVMFGRKRTEKQLDRTKLDNAKRDLDGHQIDE